MKQFPALALLGAVVATSGLETWTGTAPAYTYDVGTKCAAGKSATPVSTTTKATRASGTASCISVNSAGGDGQSYKQTCAADGTRLEQTVGCNAGCTACTGTPITYALERVGTGGQCVTGPTANAPAQQQSFMFGALTTATGDASKAFAPCFAPAPAPASTLVLGLGLGAAGLGVITLFCLRRHWAKVGGRKLSHGAPGRKFIRVWGKNAVKSPDALEDERKSGESAAEEAAAAL